MLKMIETTVPVGLEQYYTATDGGQFRLNVEGVVPVAEVESLKQKVKEFRDSNVTLVKDNEKFKNFSSILGSENLSAEKLQEKIDSLASSKLVSLTEQMKAGYETKLTELSDKYSKAGTKLNELTLGNEVVKAAADHGVISSALEDVMFRAKSAFIVDDEGVVKFKEEKLDSAGKPYTVDGWMKEVKTKAPHLFAPSQGTGAQRNSKAVVAKAQNMTATDRISGYLSSQNRGAVKRLA